MTSVQRKKFKPIHIFDKPITAEVRQSLKTKPKQYRNLLADFFNALVKSNM